MSGRRDDSHSSPLCRFQSADGRHCRLPAKPKFDGLCHHHGTFRARASRQDNFLREITRLTHGSVREQDFARINSLVSRAASEQRISCERAAILLRIAGITRLSHRYAQLDDFKSARGPAWDAVRRLLDREDAAEGPEV
jgi:hypothetical protein